MTGAAHLCKARYRQTNSVRSNARDHIICGGRIFFGYPRKELAEVVIRIRRKYYPHALRINRLNTSSRERVFVFLSARRRRTSATCSSERRYEPLSCSSIDLIASTTSSCRSFGQLRTRSRTTFTSFFDICLVYHSASPISLPAQRGCGGQRSAAGWSR